MDHIASWSSRRNVTDPLQRTVSFTYDTADRISSQTLPDGRVIGFTYDANGNVTSVTPPGRPAHSFQFTSVDLLDTYTPPSVPGGGATTYTYNRDHQMTLMTRPDSQTVALTYDTAGRIQALTAQGLSTTYGYDSAGRLGAIASSSGSSLSFAYDGPLLTQQQWSGPVSGFLENEGPHLRFRFWALS
jgi:YD repeat-containing protein